MTTRLSDLTARRLLAGYRKGDFSPVEATRAALERIEETEPRVNAFVRVDAEEAVAQAEASARRWHRGEPEGLLDGVPVTVKDLLLQRGGPTLRGSWTIGGDGPWDEDAPSVARLRAHNAVFLGKTTTPEFGWKGVTDSPRYGVTRNPWDPSRTARPRPRARRVPLAGPAAAARRPSRWARARCRSGRTAAVRSASRPPSAASSGSNRRTGGCRCTPRAPSGRWPTSGR
jgi:hypothetical protein